MPPRCLPALVTALAVVVSGCGVASHGGDASPGRAAPELASVEALADPREAEGPSTAVVADAEVRPVVSDPSPRLPVTLTDDQGTRVTVTDTSRVLALDVYGTLSRTVFELGMGDSLVGRDISTQFEEAADLPLVTGQGHELDAEALLALDPTLVITDTTLGPWDAVLQLREAGIPVVVVSSERDLDGAAALTESVAQALGVPEAGRKLARRTDREVAAVEAQVRAVAPADERERLRAIFLYVRGKSGVYHLFGEGSGADSLIEGLGLYDVAEEIGWKGMKPVTDEGIVAAQPDVILMMTDGLESVDGVDGLLERLPALAQTPAGQRRRVIDMQDSQVLGFGPLSAQVLNALAVAVYAPEAVR